jgi:hypothetical protein
MTESKSCHAVQALLREGAAGLPEGDGGELRSHLRACPACRERALRHDPALIFLGLASEPVPEGTWDGFEAGLRARLRREAAEPAWRALFRPGLARYPKIAWAVPALMVLVLGVTLSVVRPDRQRPGWWPRPGGRPPARAAVPPPGSPARAAAPAAPIMEGVASPGARVYRFSVGGPGDETSIYFVVDDAIDL